MNTAFMYVIEIAHQKGLSQEMPSGDVSSSIMMIKRSMWRHLLLGTIGLLGFLRDIPPWKLLSGQKEDLYWCNCWGLCFLISYLSLNKTSACFVLIK